MTAGIISGIKGYTGRSENIVYFAKALRSSLCWAVHQSHALSLSLSPYVEKYRPICIHLQTMQPASESSSVVSIFKTNYALQHCSSNNPKIRCSFSTNNIAATSRRFANSFGSLDCLISKLSVRSQFPRNSELGQIWTLRDSAVDKLGDIRERRLLSD